VTLGGLPREPLRLVLRKIGYTIVERAPIAPDTGSLEVTLVESRFVPLRVLDADGRPAADVVLGVEAADGRRVILQDQYGNHDGEEAATDRAGRADLRGVPAAAVTLVVVQDERLLTFELDVRDPPRAMIEIRLPE
jgi:hypothetical protein